MSCHANIASPVILYQPNRRKSFLQKLRNYSVKKLLSIAQENIMSSFQVFSPGIKKDGSKRMILNLKNFKKFVNYKHFKMESINNVLNIIRPGVYMASIDLKDAFFSASIHPTHQTH